VPDLLVANDATRLLPKKETDHDDDRVWSDHVTGNDATSLPTAKEKAPRCHVVAGNDTTSLPTAKEKAPRCHVVAGNDVTTASSKETAARYACTWPGCRKTFVQRRSVRTHQHNVHTARPVRCAECGKLYSNLANLKTHR
jgi:hypothetical protein